MNRRVFRFAGPHRYLLDFGFLFECGQHIDGCGFQSCVNVRVHVVGEG